MPSILAVGTRAESLARARTSEPAVRQSRILEVGDAKSATAMLRVVPFDLLAVGPLVECEGGPWPFVRRVRVAWPDQRWVWVDDELSLPDELLARTLGAAAVLDGPDAWRHVVELAAHLRAGSANRGRPALRLRIGPGESRAG